MTKENISSSNSSSSQFKPNNQQLQNYPNRFGSSHYSDENYDDKSNNNGVVLIKSSYLNRQNDEEPFNETKKCNKI